MFTTFCTDNLNDNMKRIQFYQVTSKKVIFVNVTCLIEIGVVAGRKIKSTAFSSVRKSITTMENTCLTSCQCVQRNNLCVCVWIITHSTMLEKTPISKQLVDIEINSKKSISNIFGSVSSPEKHPTANRTNLKQYITLYVQCVCLHTKWDSIFGHAHKLIYTRLTHLTEENV